jgi:hypothetical protein
MTGSVRQRCWRPVRGGADAGTRGVARHDEQRRPGPAAAWLGDGRVLPSAEAGDSSLGENSRRTAYGFIDSGCWFRIRSARRFANCRLGPSPIGSKWPTGATVCHRRDVIAQPAPRYRAGTAGAAARWVAVNLGCTVPASGSKVERRADLGSEANGGRWLGVQCHAILDGQGESQTADLRVGDAGDASRDRAVSTAIVPLPCA